MAVAHIEEGPRDVTGRNTVAPSTISLKSIVAAPASRITGARRGLRRVRRNPVGSRHAVSQFVPRRPPVAGLASALRYDFVTAERVWSRVDCTDSAGTDRMNGEMIQPSPVGISRDNETTRNVA